MVSVQTYLDFLYKYLDRISPLFGTALFAVPVYLLLTTAGVCMIKSIISGGFRDV